MTDYTNLIDKVNIPELVKALRHCISDPYGFVECDGCPIFCKGIDCQNNLHNDAAAVIEELQDKVVELEEELNDADIATDDNGRQVEELQAEIERLKDSNEELRERQTYIDHYGTEWLTSAKDVPNYAYEHGYADGMAEVKAQLPKRGEWIRIDKHTVQCPLCHRYLDLRSVNAGRGDANYCPNCGAKMEAQE